MRPLVAPLSPPLLAAALCFALALAAGAQEPGPAAEGASAPSPPAPTSEGLEQLLQDLVAREESLRTGERDLAERQRSFGELEAQLQLRVAEIEAIRDEVELRIAAFEEQGGDRVGRLAKVYAAMPPARVAALVQDLPRELATSVLTRMREKNSAAILAVLPREEAVALSKRIARPLGTPAKPAQR